MSLKIAILTCLVASSLATVTLNCQFVLQSNVYGCYLIKALLLSTDEPVVFTGNHASGRHDGYVSVISITQSRVVVIASEFFAKFTATSTFESIGGGLERIPKNTFQNATALKTVTIDSSDLVALEAGAFNQNTNVLSKISIKSASLREIVSGVFPNMTNLLSLTLQNCSISAISVDAFESMSKLKELNLMSNQLTNISGNVFRPLSNLEVLEISDNKIKRLESDWFLQNGANLRIINFQNNKIAQVNSKFLNNLVKLASFLMVGNNCSNANVTEEGHGKNFTSVLHESLSKCYEQYANGIETDTTVTTVLTTEEVQTTASSEKTTSVSPTTLTTVLATTSITGDYSDYTTQTRTSTEPSTTPSTKQPTSPPSLDPVRKFLLEFTGQLRVIDDNGNEIMKKNVDEMFKFN